MKWIMVFYVIMFCASSIGAMIFGDLGQMGVAIFFAILAVSYVIAIFGLRILEKINQIKTNEQ